MIKKSPNTKKTTAKKVPTKKKSAPKKKAAKSSPKTATTRKKGKVPAKKAAPKATGKPRKPESNVTVLRTAKCSSLSGKSTLTYNVGLDDSGAVCLRVNGNSGGGFFSREPVPLERIDAVLGKVPEDRPITSFTLEPLFTNHSANNPGFMAAVMLKEGLLQPLSGKKRSYSYTGTEAFLAGVEKLKEAK